MSLPSKVIKEGIINKANGDNVPYTLEVGLNKESIIECNSWNDFVTNIIINFKIENPKLDDYDKVLREKIMLDDHHWNWTLKAFKFNTSEYNWFFLKTIDGIQGLCITFHPKKSILQNVDIFYIEYISSAPWNRDSALHKRLYKGIGSEIIKQVQYYFLENHKYSHGFNLQSLQQSRKFYEHIGMVNIPKYNDGNNLFFYEMSKENAILFLEGKYARD